MTPLTDFNPIPFGKYFLLKSLDSGTFSKSYKAKTYGAKGFEKYLLLQQINPGAQMVAFVDALTEEFKRVVKVSHPNVLPFYDFGSVKEQYFLTQEYLEGLTIRQFMELENERGQTLSPAESLYIISEILKGLQSIHTRFKGAQSLVHGHIQPKTIFVSRDGEIKITGLGYERLALKFGISDLVDTQYQAETWMRTGIWDVADDLRMCSLVLFELMTGSPLLTKLPEESGKTTVTKEFLKNYFQDGFYDFFCKAFSIDGQDGFLSALDMAVALQRILYSQFPEFSSQHLVQRLQKHFVDANNLPLVPQHLSATVFLEDTLKELVKSSRDQINLVHREGTDFSTLLADTVALSAYDAAIFFPETQSVKAVLPTLILQNESPSSLPIEAEKNATRDDGLDDGIDIEEEISPNEELLMGMFAIKDASRRTWILILSGSFFVLVFVLGLVALQAPEKPKETAEVRTDFQFQLVIDSVPTGALVWLDGKMTDQATPATFLTLEKNKNYSIVIKKEGFEDFHTILKNESGKDQVLDVTLREL